MMNHSLNKQKKAFSSSSFLFVCFVKSLFRIFLFGFDVISAFGSYHLRRAPWASAPWALRPRAGSQIREPLRALATRLAKL